jgi:hypothetical protein
MDIEGQMAELEREREQLKRSLRGEIEAGGNGAANGDGLAAAAAAASETAGVPEERGEPPPTAASAWEAAPVDPEAT